MYYLTTFKQYFWKTHYLTKILDSISKQLPWFSGKATVYHADLSIYHAPLNIAECNMQFIFWMNEFFSKLILNKLVMFRAWIFRASGGLGLLCIGPWAGRAFLYRVSSFFRAFQKYKMYPHFCLMSMKYEVLLLNF